ncbi:MAG: MerR family transcriptional regulator [Deltaproteobacteria bacterium]|nr:MerR family transcriptional regulator [Deltaproteobacteria bacterium]
MFLSKKEGFTSREVQVLTGLTNRNLQYWDEQGVFPPSLSRPAGRSPRSGNRRLYSPLDVMVLQAVAALKQKGMSFQRIRKTLRVLRDEMGIEKPFHTALNGSGRISLLTDGKNFYLCRNDREVVNVLKNSGQYLLLPLGEMAQDLKVRVRDLQRSRRDEAAARVSRNGARRAASR